MKFMIGLAAGFVVAAIVQTRVTTNPMAVLIAGGVVAALVWAMKPNNL